jgi:thiamine-monophosphate kinase
MGERTRTARYFAPLASAEPGSFSLTDDAALLTPPSGQSLVVTTDSVIENIHVLPGATPAQFAQKLVRRNLSDLAAMGADPWRYTLNLHTPYGLAEEWFAGFSHMLAEQQKQFGMVLVGGDSTSAPGAAIHATMTCFGLIDGAPLLRSGTQIGEDVYVSGTIGDAALGLLMLQQKLPAEATLVARYHVPEPRLALGCALRGIATSAIDISDGLLADLAQICVASGVGAQVTRAAIPCSRLVGQQPELWDTVLNGGDDYELCFTAPASAREALALLANTVSLPLTRIGEITAGKDVVLVDEAGKTLPVSPGFTHR